MVLLCQPPYDTISFFTILHALGAWVFMTISDTTLGLSVRETTFKSAFITGSLQAVFIVLTLYIGLNLTGFDLRVPLAYSGDALSQVMFVKGMMLNGWACEIPQLSQPYSFHAAAFPIATSVDWLLMKAISLFTSEVGLVVNLFWMFSVCLTAWIATFSFTCPWDQPVPGSNRGSTLLLSPVCHTPEPEPPESCLLPRSSHMPSRALPHFRGRRAKEHESNSHCRVRWVPASGDSTIFTIAILQSLSWGTLHWRDT